MLYKKLSNYRGEPQRVGRDNCRHAQHAQRRRPVVGIGHGLAYRLREEAVRQVNDVYSEDGIGADVRGVGVGEAPLVFGIILGKIPVIRAERCAFDTIC